MPVFIRKNLLTISAVFAANDGTDTQPTSVVAYVNYNNRSGQRVTDQITCSYDSTSKEWSGHWDSSNAEQGNVEWMIYGSGALQAAQQGSFQVLANLANVA